ncbi:hypothetical protein CMT41_10610 [Colwellia sp. MT41]|uniref:glycosyltransferase family 4 protein n=1 Tax=Colwellia sp. MT41 TaxID=58049 RepID=UPI000717AEB2|nr:glycosyltransferase family 4 protein [Colwellia sp. MT41]ALO35119.1 hypothetical protein CMT41_10610 [Colwellia sp. MT41]
MKTKICVVSTSIKSGKGGISTALVGYQQSSVLNKNSIEYLCSHDDKNKFKLFLSVVKHIIFDRKKDVMYWFHCAQWLSLTRKFTLAVLAKLRGHKIFFHFHSPIIADYFESSWKRQLLKVMLLLSDGIIVLTPWWEKQFLKYYPFLEKRIFIAPNPLDSELLIAANTTKVISSSEQVKILSMARLIEGKGFQHVIKAMSYLPANYELHIAGDGPYENALRKLVDKLHLNERVFFLGWVSYEKKSSIYQQADVFCLPSKYDSFGMCYIEAMAYGVPIVALNYQAIPDVVPNGKAGILCDSSEPEEVAKAILQCCLHKVEMGAVGKQHVLQYFSPDKISRGLLGFFNRIKGGSCKR